MTSPPPFISLKGLPERTARTIRDETSSRKELQTIREHGYAVDDEENEKGIRCVGALAHDNTEMPVAAIRISGLTVRVTKEAIRGVFRKKIVNAASQISYELGRCRSIKA